MVIKVRSKLKDAQLAKKVGQKATTFQSASSQHINKHLKKRVQRVANAKRFIAGWLVLVLLIGVATLFSSLQLRSNSLVAAPQDGGTYIEGMVGSTNSLNPLFGSGIVDDSASRLLFNGLLKHDQSGELVGDLAQQWNIDKDRTTYTIDLRTDVRWHDGQPFTADDVVYTITTIQDPQVRSSMHMSWRGVDVKKVGPHQVSFELPAPFTPFLTALTVPILPHHLLKDVEPARLRTAGFNSQPIGTGPFIFQALRSSGQGERRVEFVRNEQYHHGSPRVDRFVLRVYEESNELAAALRGREITAAAGVTGTELSNLQSDKTVRMTSTPINSGVFAFFKTTAPLLKDSKVRQALVQSVDRQAVLDLFDHRYTPLKTPLLPSQLGYDARYAQKSDLTNAKKLLDQAGWKVSSEQTARSKGKEQLKLSLVTVNNSEYESMAEELQKQWASLGVTVETSFLTPEELQRTALAANAYDILLYGISIDRDPDVYAYWHSSQAKAGGLNFSLWRSPLADTALDVARTRSENVLRVARYKTFLSEWQKQAPAVALYQPRSSYVYHQNARGFVSLPANTIADRLTNVEDWTVSTRLVSRTP